MVKSRPYLRSFGLRSYSLARSGKTESFNASLSGELFSNTKTEPVDQITATYCDERPKPLNVEMMDDAMAEVLRAKSPAERLAIANGMWRSASRMIEAILRAERPDWTDDEIRREVARRMSHGAV